MKTEPNDPAHPTLEQDGIYTSLWNTVAGLTKREQLSAMAMQGLLSNNYIIEQYKPEYIAEVAVQQADYLIQALNKES